MAYYFIAQINIVDPAEYQNYLDKAQQVFRNYRGTYLAVDNNTQVVEGQWNYSRTVIISFESESDFNQWYYSREYQEILKHRLKGAHCTSTLVKGLEPKSETSPGS